MYIYVENHIIISKVKSFELNQDTLFAGTTGGFSIWVLLASGDPLVIAASDASARTATSGSSLNCMPAL